MSAKHARVPCPICERLYSKNNMYLHLRAHDEGERFTCTFCGRTLSTLSKLAHIRDHTAAGWTKCEICHINYRKRYLKRHLQLIAHRRAAGEVVILKPRADKGIMKGKKGKKVEGEVKDKVKNNVKDKVKDKVGDKVKNNVKDKVKDKVQDDWFGRRAREERVTRLKTREPVLTGRVEKRTLRGRTRIPEKVRDPEHETDEEEDSAEESDSDEYEDEKSDSEGSEGEEWGSEDEDAVDGWDCGASIAASEESGYDSPSETEIQSVSRSQLRPR